MKNWLPPVSAQSSASPRSRVNTAAVDLVADGVAGTPSPSPRGSPILHHEVRHHAVQLDAAK